MQNFEVYEHF